MAGGGEGRLARFRQVSAERLSRLNLDWVRLEQEAADPAVARRFFADLHTLKGEASIMGFPEAASVAHALEDLAQGCLGRGSPPDAATGDRFFEGLDQLARLLVPVPATAPADSGAPAVPAGPTPTPGMAVDGNRADRMRGLVGDLFFLATRLETATRALDPDLRDDVGRLVALCRTLDEVTAAMRMVPVRRLFEPYPRAVRDLGRELGRDVELLTHGEDVCINREVLDALEEPLVHVIRNAVDHGIESPDERVAAGKPRRARLRLAAMVRAGFVELEVGDDGRGIDVDAVRTRAVSLGLLPAAEAEAATAARVLACLFAPGMTTRREVTGTSGRGVGLDAVQRAATALGGAVEVVTEREKGTTFRVSVPVRVALTPVVLFRVGEGRYAFQAAAVEAIVDGTASPLVHGIAGSALRLGGELVPVASILDRLGGGEGPPEAAARYLIVRVGTRRVALAGTTDHQRREAVIKSAPGLGHALVSGAFALEDGSVALVLEPGEVMAPTTARPAWPQRLVAEAAPVAASAVVLVVDDSPVARDLVAECLRGQGLEVIEAEDGEDALRRLAERVDIDLVVTDIDMPRMNGLELVRRLREGGSRRLPAIVVSSRGSNSDKAAALKVGADAYLVKQDFSRDRLWQLVSRFVGAA